MGRIIVVKATWDAEAGVWVAESADLPGLITEAESLDALDRKLPGIILDLLDSESENGGDLIEYPIELVAHRSLKVRAAAA